MPASMVGCWRDSTGRSPAPTPFPAKGPAAAAIGLPSPHQPRAIFHRPSLLVHSGSDCHGNPDDRRRDAVTCHARRSAVNFIGSKIVHVHRRLCNYSALNILHLNFHFHSTLSTFIPPLAPFACASLFSSSGLSHGCISRRHRIYTSRAPVCRDSNLRFFLISQCSSAPGLRIPIKY